jgi:hypothetical protein
MVDVTIVTGKPNPFDYDDDSFTRASGEMMSSIESMWSAGASPDDIANAVKDALESAGAE